jgi:hypothetical protein
MMVRALGQAARREHLAIGNADLLALIEGAPDLTLDDVLSATGKHKLQRGRDPVQPRDTVFRPVH